MSEKVSNLSFSQTVKEPMRPAHDMVRGSNEGLMVEIRSGQNAALQGNGQMRRKGRGPTIQPRTGWKQWGGERKCRAAASSQNYSKKKRKDSKIEPLLGLTRQEVIADRGCGKK